MYIVREIIKNYDFTYCSVRLVRIFLMRVCRGSSDRMALFSSRNVCSGFSRFVTYPEALVGTYMTQRLREECNSATDFVYFCVTVQCQTLDSISCYPYIFHF